MQRQSGVVLSLCPFSATGLCLEETVLPSYYLYISLIVEVQSYVDVSQLYAAEMYITI